MKLLITGADGFIGSYAVAAARARGWKVDRRSRRAARLRAHYDCVLHLGGYSSNAGFATSLAANYDNNINSLADILAVANRIGCRVVYASSSAVYGNGESINAEDDVIDLTDTASHYARSKLINEMMAESYRSIGLNCLGLRIFNAYGEGDELKPIGRQAPPTWMRAAKERGEPMVIYGDGTQAKDFIHVSDVAEIMMRLIESDATGIVNVGTGVATSFNDLARALGGWKDIGVSYEPIPNPDQFYTCADTTRLLSYQFYTCADTTRLLSIIGPYKFISIEEGLIYDKNRRVQRSEAND